MRTDANTLRFIAHVREMCARHKVSLQLRHAKRVDSGDGVKCHGFFENDTRRLVVAADGDVASWLPVLVHEYGHMTQWLDEDPLWTAAEDEMFISWLDGERNLSREKRQSAFRASRDMELDCERRAVRLIRRWKLPISVPRYIQMSNAYIGFYAVALWTRAWYTKGPWEVPAVMAQCKTRFMDRRWYDVPHFAFFDAVVTHCVPRKLQRRYA